MSEALITKNREANELRARAKAMLEAAAAPDYNKGADGWAADKKEIDALISRAQTLAEFSVEKEIQRQGGETADLRRVDGPGADGALDDSMPKTGGWKAKQDMVRKAILKEFGNMADYVLTCGDPKRMAACSEAQKTVLHRVQMVTRTIIGVSGDPSGGEYLLPLEQEPSIFMIENEQQGLLQRARRYSVSGRTLRIPYVRQTDPTNARPTSGIANVSIVGEAQSKPDLEPAFSQRLLTVYKYAAIAQIGDETIRDDFTGDLQPVVSALVGGQCLNAMNENFTYSGTGLSMPLAALNTGNPSLLTFTRGGGANTKTLAPLDIFTMYSYHTHGPNSAWYVSRRTVQGIFALALTSGSTGVAFVSFLQNMRGKPEMVLMGLPIIETDILPTWGTQGDINLVNPDFYAVGLRQQLTVESSIHVAFIQDVTTYRYLCRGGGLPIPDGTYAYQASGGTELDPHSPFVQLI